MTQKAEKNKTAPTIEILTPHQVWKKLDFDIEAVVRGCINAALPYIDLSANSAGIPFEISIVLASDPMIQILNNQYRHKDQPTNVLSFPAQDLDEPLQPDTDYLLGDIILSYETIARESEEQEKAFKDHFSHLVIHGFLHLLRYDHEEDEDAQMMEELEIKILGAMGIKNPYD